MEKFQGTGLISKGLIVLLLTSTLISCKSFGPRVLRVNRQSYNEVIAQTEQEQLLQNIVRLRYGEPTYFLKITSVNTSYNLTANSPTGTFGYASNGHPLGAEPAWTQTESVALPTVNYADTPTFSYQPLDNKEFVTALLQPLTMTQLEILYSGEIHDFLFLSRLIIDSVGDLDNASSITGRKIREFPEYRDYFKMMALIRKSRLNHTLYIKTVKLQNSFAFAIFFQSRAASVSPDILKIKRMLNVPADADAILLSDAYHFCGKNDIQQAVLTNEIPAFIGSCPPNRVVYVSLRSVLEIMRYLSFSVDVPPEDIRAGFVETIIDPETGRPFDWSVISNGIMHIYSSDTEPSGRNIYLKVYTHHHWFYILNSDMDSKVTLAFLLRLMTLIAGSSVAAPTNAPVLTLPVR